MLSIIVAVASNNTIGNENKLLWELPNDLKRFKKITIGHTIIMGRKTFKSLPYILPGRRHIVITRNKSFKVEDDRVIVVYSIEEILPYINDQKEYFVVGGAEIYRQLLPYVEKLYLTIVDHEFEGDAVFPQIDFMLWKVVERISGIQDDKNKYPYIFVTLKKDINISKEEFNLMGCLLHDKNS